MEEINYMLGKPKVKYQEPIHLVVEPDELGNKT